MYEWALMFKFDMIAGVFASSWIGGVFVSIGEYIIRKLPLVKHIYSAAKQVSGAVAPDQTTKSFRYETAINYMYTVLEK